MIIYCYAKIIYSYTKTLPEGESWKDSIPPPVFWIHETNVDLNFCFIFPVVLFTVSQNLFAGSAARSELAKSQVAWKGDKSQKSQ